MDRRRVRTPKRRLAPEEVEAELARLRTALELSDIAARRGEGEGGGRRRGRAGAAEHTAIIDMHRMMLHDEMLVDEVQRLIREERINAEWAVKRAVRKIKSAFDEHADEYFQERRADVDYVGERIVKNLLGQARRRGRGAAGGRHRRRPRPLAGGHGAPPARADRWRAFVTDAGAKTWHTAIVARALEIPAVVGVGRITALAERGDWIVVDGSRGRGAGQPDRRASGPTTRRPESAASGPRRRELLRTRDLPARHPGRRHRSGWPATSSSPRRSRACSPTAARGWGSTAPSSSSWAAATSPPRRSTTRTTGASSRRWRGGR